MCVKDRYSLARQAARVLVNVDKIPSNTEVPCDCVALCQLEQALKKHKNDPNRALLKEVWGERHDEFYLGADSARLVSYLLLAGADVNAQDEDDEGNTLLHKLAQDAHVVGRIYNQKTRNALPIARLIINAGAGFNRRNKIGETPLLRAYCYKNLFLTILLFQLNAHWLESEYKYTKPSKLHIEAAKGNHEQVKKLLRVDDAILLKELLDADIHNVKYMKEILERVIPVDIVDNGSTTPLHWAAAAGYVNCINVLLQAGADVNKLDDQHLTPLHLAAWNGNEEAVQVLLQAGALPNPPSSYKRPAPLSMAAENGHLKISQMLMGAGARVNSNYAQDDLTPLHRAARRGHADVAEFLIQAGADANHRENPRKFTPLHLAIELGQIELVQILLQGGADPNIRSGLLETPLMLAAKRGFVKVVKLLIQAGADANMIVDPQKYPSVLHMLSSSPLGLAIDVGYLEVVRILVQAGADPNIQSEDGETFVDLAAENGHTDIAHFLIQAGVKYRKTFRLLRVAAKNGHVGLTKTLIQAGVSGYMQDGLLVASAVGRTEIVQILLQAGADVNYSIPQLMFDKYTPQEENIPLCLAARNGHAQAVKLLLQAGAKVDAGLANRDSTPLHLAVEGGHVEVVQILLQAGADPYRKDGKGNTVLDVAVKLGNYKLATILRESRPIIFGRSDFCYL